MRASCCNKKRKPTQLKYINGYDHGSFICKDGFGCKNNIKKIKEEGKCAVKE